MFIGISCRIIFHQSFIPYVYRNIIPRHLSSIIHTLCLSGYHAHHPSLIIHTLYYRDIMPIIPHQSFIPYVYGNIISRHPSSIIHTLCLSVYNSPSSFINHSYPMFIGISFPSSFINHSYPMFIGISFQSLFINHAYLMFIGILCPVILLFNNSYPMFIGLLFPVILPQSFIPYVYRNIIPHHPSSIIHTRCLSEYHSPSSFINHSYPMFIGISCPIILHQSFIPYV